MTTRNQQSMRIGGGDAETVASLEKQHEMVDTQMRSTDGIDYAKVRQEAEELLTKRRQGIKTAELQTVAARDYPYFSTKFPQFTKSITKDCSLSRLSEFTKVMHSLLDGLEKVQRGELSQTALRESLFEKELATRYLRPK